MKKNAKEYRLRHNIDLVGEKTKAVHANTDGGNEYNLTSEEENTVKNEEKTCLFTMEGGRPDQLPFRRRDPILDSRAPTSTEGTYYPLMLADSLGLPFKLEPPRAVYEHGWGVECLNAKITRFTWYITVMDAEKQVKIIPFDLVDGHSPLIADKMKTLETIKF